MRPNFINKRYSLTSALVSNEPPTTNKPTGNPAFTTAEGIKLKPRFTVADAPQIDLFASMQAGIPPYLRGPYSSIRWRT